MTFEVRPHPEFSWSISRQRTLDKCPRSYFHAYYLCHNGWMDNAAPEARAAYQLKQLTSLDLLLGLEIDKRARELENCARRREPLPGRDELERRTRGALNDAWRSSRDRVGFERDPKRTTMLRALYLGQSTEREVGRVGEKIGPSLDGLLSVSHWSRLQECGEQGRVSIPAFAHFMLDGLKVYAAPDLAYVHQHTLHVIDWKSGREDESDPVQVILQVHYLLQSDLALTNLDVSAHLEYVQSALSKPVEMPEEMASAVSEVVADGAAQMKSLLRDVDANIPKDVEAFERRESGLCSTCNFSPLCQASSR